MKFLIWVILLITPEQYLLYDMKTYHREGLLAIESDKLWLRIGNTVEEFKITYKYNNYQGNYYFVESEIAKGEIAIHENTIVIHLTVDRSFHFKKKYLHTLPKRP